MDELKRRLLTRQSGYWTDCFPVAVFLSLMLMLVGIVFSSILELATGLKPVLQSFGNEAAAQFAEFYLSFAGIWIAFFLFSRKKGNRPMLSCLAFRKDGRNRRGALIGLGLGVLTNGFCILMSCLMGSIHLTFNEFRPGLFLLFFVAVMIQSGAEELVDRCYLYQKLRRGYTEPWMAIGINSLVFMILHLPNDGINTAAKAQIILIGILFSLFVYYYDSLWAAIMMHTGWNFTQSILFGLPNSGMVSSYSLFKLEAASARSGLFYNVNFGVEGSIGAVVVIGVLLAVVLRRSLGKGEKRDLWASPAVKFFSAGRLHPGTDVVR